jgi:valyl-tRNA synthetase
LRYTFYSLATTGRDINFDMGRIEGYRNFCNKIWNAARYVFMNCEEQTVTKPIDNKHYSRADLWIQSRFQDALKKVNEGVAVYRFDLVAQAVYDFFWNEYCDWYLELSKPVLWDEKASDEHKNATRYTLLSILEQSLRLAHPLMPFITEEIWQKAAPMLGITGETVMVQPYPEENNSAVSADVDAEIEWVKTVILALRNIRGELNISPAKAIPVLCSKGGARDQAFLQNNRQFLVKLAKLESIEWLDDSSKAPPASMQLAGDMEIRVPLAGLIDVKAEQARLTKEIDKLKADGARITAQLSNERFVANAPPAVVAKERDRLAGFEGSLRQLQEQLEKLDTL